MARPLDSIEPYVTAAWGLGQLLTSYAGALGRVSRSSDSAELDIGALGDGTIDRYAVENHHGSIVGITDWIRWYDQKGGGRTLTGANQAIAKQTGNGTSGLVGDSIGSLFNTGVLTYDAGAALNNVLLTAGVGTVFVVGQCWAAPASNAVFADNGGWWGFRVKNAGAASNLSLSAEAWHWVAAETVGGPVTVNRYRTFVGIWRYNGININTCIDGTWGTPTTSSAMGGSGNVFRVGGMDQGQVVCCVTSNAEISDAACETVGRALSDVWCGHWPAAAAPVGVGFSPIGPGGPVA